MVLLSSVSLTEKLDSNCEMRWGMISARRWARLERVNSMRMFCTIVSKEVSCSPCRGQDLLDYSNPRRS